LIKYLLDTNVISEAIKTVPNQNVMNQLQQHQDEIATASLVWHELQYGCRRLPASRKRSLIKSYLAEVVWHTIAILPYDAAAADWHAEQRAQLTTAGKAPPFIDGQIAAVAKVNNLILITRNISDYMCFKDVIIQNWHVKNEKQA
jgi:tRNA(fMet)-specific endonuclease VapC